MIAESHEELWKEHPDRRWIVAARPYFELGALDDTLLAEVYPIAGVRRLDDGRIVLAGGGGAVLWFTSGGDFQFRRGGFGAGPGELRSVGQMLFWPPDSVAVVERGRRILIFDGAGVWGQVSFVLSGGRLAGIARLADGRWVGWGNADGREVRFDVNGTVPGFYRPGRALVLVSGDGARLDTIAFFPGRFVEIPRAGAAESPGRDYAASSPAVLALSTESVFAVMDDEIVVGDGRDHALTVVRANGSPLRKIRWAGEDLTVRASDHEAWRRAIVSTTYGSPGSDERWVEGVVTRVRFAERKGAYVGLLVDPDLNIWVRRNIIMTEAEDYTVLDRHGRLIGNVTMPRGFRLSQVGRDYVLGIWNDEMDRDYVRVYELRKPPEQRDEP